MGMGTAGIQWNLRVSREYGYECCGNGSDNCRIPAGMDIIIVATPQECTSFILVLLHAVNWRVSSQFEINS